LGSSNGRLWLSHAQLGNNASKQQIQCAGESDGSRQAEPFDQPEAGGENADRTSQTVEEVEGCDASSCMSRKPAQDPAGHQGESHTQEDGLGQDEQGRQAPFGSGYRSLIGQGWQEAC
jgi:hypothetical protein